MDPIADVPKMVLPLLDFVTRYETAIGIVVIAVSLLWRPLMDDNARRPRALYEALFGKGTSNGRGDVPGEGSE